MTNINIAKIKSIVGFSDFYNYIFRLDKLLTNIVSFRYKYLLKYKSLLNDFIFDENIWKLYVSNINTYKSINMTSEDLENLHIILQQISNDSKLDNFQHSVEYKNINNAYRTAINISIDIKTYLLHQESLDKEILDFISNNITKDNILKLFNNISNIYKLVEIDLKNDVSKINNISIGQSNISVIKFNHVLNFFHKKNIEHDSVSCIGINTIKYDSISLLHTWSNKPKPIDSVLINELLISSISFNFKNFDIINKYLEDFLTEQPITLTIFPSNRFTEKDIILYFDKYQNSLIDIYKDLKKRNLGNCILTDLIFNVFAYKKVSYSYTPILNEKYNHVLHLKKLINLKIRELSLNEQIDNSNKQIIYNIRKKV